MLGATTKTAANVISMMAMVFHFENRSIGALFFHLWPHSGAGERGVRLTARPGVRYGWRGNRGAAQDFAGGASLTGSPLAGLVDDRMSAPCRDKARVVAKNKLAAIMCAGL